MSSNATDSATLISAGFLLYSFAPQTGGLYFLLGQEKYVPGWYDSNRWSDFSGCKQADEDDIQCAIREFGEETLHCVQFDQSLALNSFTDSTIQQSSETMTALMLQKQYLLKLEALYQEPPESESLRKKICFVKEIPWQPQVPENFAECLRLMSSLSKLPTPLRRVEYWQNHIQHTSWARHPALVLVFLHDQEKAPEQQANVIVDVQVKTEWLEKCSISWWSIPRLKQVILQDGKFKKQFFRRSFMGFLRIIMDILTMVEFYHIECRQNIDSLLMKHILSEMAAKTAQESAKRDLLAESSTALSLSSSSSSLSLLSSPSSASSSSSDLNLLHTNPAYMCTLSETGAILFQNLSDIPCTLTEPLFFIDF
jgi:hypothetical protein